MLSFETKVSPKIENLQLKMFQWSTDPGSEWETTHRYKKKIRFKTFNFQASQTNRLTN